MPQGRPILALVPDGFFPPPSLFSPSIISFSTAHVLLETLHVNVDQTERCLDPMLQLQYTIKFLLTYIGL